MEFFVMELKFKYCKLCGNEYKRVCDLSYHVQHVHDISPKEYYDRYLKEENEGICPVCGKRNKFFGRLERDIINFVRLAVLTSRKKYRIK